ncbi:MAG: hypothetical protein ABH869_08245 [Candidatus Omnitrophota bacterium]
MRNKRSAHIICMLCLIITLVQTQLIYASDEKEKKLYFEKAVLYNEQQEWGKSIWYYKKYLLEISKNDSTYYDVLYTIAHIYYKKLQKYYYALEIYKKLLGKLDEDRNQIIEEIVKRLEDNNDGDLFLYAFEHDLNLSDHKSLFKEINNLLPEEAEVYYKYKRGFDGTFKTFKVVYTRGMVEVLDDRENKVVVISLEEFIKLWANLILIEWYDVPEENAIILGPPKRTFTSVPSYLAYDVSSVEIVVKENGQQIKAIHIATLELASKELRNINNYFQVILSGEK